MTTTHAETLRTLVTRPDCTDAVIERLTALAGDGRDARLTSDLAAAHYVRAQRDDRASDLLAALETARQAVRVNPALPAAQFNLALAQEALGFTGDARRTWETAGQLDRSPWANEANEHRARIDRMTARAAATQWTLNRQRLPEAIGLGDRAAVEQLIRPFPAATQRYVEEEVLPAWCAARSADRLSEALVIASEHSRITGDPHLLEIVDRVARASATDLDILAQGHIAFGKARSLDRAHDSKAAVAAYREAAQAFARVDSPLRMGAELGHAIQLSLATRDKRPRERTLAELEPQARRRGYLNLWARMQSNRANFLQIEGHYLDALALYEEARKTFERMNDGENLANVHVRKAGIFRVLGHEEAAMGEILLAQRDSSKLQEFRFRHLLAGETASTALALGFPTIAFAYQNAFIDTLQRELENPSADQNTKQGMRVNLAIALPARAAIRLRLRDYEGARLELEEAISITGQAADENIRNGIRAYIAEVRGLAALSRKPPDPRLAIEAFTEALALSETTQYRTLRTILLTRRAEAHRLAGQKREAEQDLRAAIAELNREEAELLAGRRRGEGEWLWSDYFSRFQESYTLLIRQLVEESRKEEAFAYAEKSRAFEPLRLVLELPVTPEALRSLDMRSADTRALAQIRSSLPAGTFLLEYQVADDGTFVWIVSRDDVRFLRLPTGRKAIEGWIRSLQRAAVTQNSIEFNRQLAVPYAALIEGPLAAVARIKNGRAPQRRLVIVPDRFMHGLPFNALRNPKTNRHLVQDYPVSIAASAALYVFALQRDQEFAAAGGDPRALFIGDPAFDQSLELTRRLRRLRGARMEAEQAGALYGSAARILVERDATVPAFLALSREREIVHVAGHAIANRHAPFGALLVMAKSENHSGLLYAEELLTKLELDRARLVVLSACSSAGGAPVGPEGLAPLVRPVVGAGVPAILGSLWTINDAASTPVLVEFHRQFRHGHDAATALQMAQIRFLSEKGDGIPIWAWAPFQIVGHASSPYSRNVINRRTSP